MSSRTVIDSAAVPGPTASTTMPSALAARSLAHIASREASAIRCAFIPDCPELVEGSAIAELRRALGQERGDALAAVVRARQFALSGSFGADGVADVQRQRGV